MKIKEVANMAVQDRFLYWIKERHAIYLKREKGESKPWTDDEVLRNYFFTNPYRENDKVTKWIKENIRDKYAKHPNLWFMLCIARQINRPSTLQMMMDKKAWPTGKTWNAKRAGRVLDAYKADGHRVYTGAYMIRAESDPKKLWYSWTKQQYMTQIVLGKVWNNTRSQFRLHAKSLESTCEYLQRFHGWGGFMSYEVVSDLRWTRYLKNAPDIMTWANPGPGARRGLNRIHERNLKTPWKVSTAVSAMRDLLAVCRRRMPASMPKFEMREVEHSLCEFDKYERMRLSQGKSKRKYNGA